MAERSPSLGDRAEALLSSFGMPELDEEALAARILARLDPGARGSTDWALLQPPLPDDAGEPGALPLSVRAELLDLESHSRLLPADGLQPVALAPDLVAVRAPALSPDDLTEGPGLPAALVPAGASTGIAPLSGEERPTDATELPATGLPGAGASEGLPAAGLGLPVPGADSGAAALLRPALGGLTPAPPPAGQSLAALARAVAQSGGAGKGARSQVTDIAKESFSVAAAARAQTDAIVERVRSAEKSPESVPPPASPARALPGAPSAVTAATTARSAPPPRSTSSGERSWQWFALAGTLALAAGVVLVLRGSQNSESAQAALAETRAQAVSASPSLVAEAPSPHEATKPEDHAASPSLADAPAIASPEAPTQKAEATAALAAAPRSVTTPANPSFGATPDRPMARAPSSARPGRPQPESIVLEETPAASPNDANPASNASNPEAHLKPAAGSAAAGGLPDKPATGAVQAALGSVMGAARACVAGAASPTPAQIVFGSDGSVKSVQLGSSAGAAAGCVEAALKRARVAPFANPSFSVNVSVRP